LHCSNKGGKRVFFIPFLVGVLLIFFAFHSLFFFFFNMIWSFCWLIMIPYMNNFWRVKENRHNKYALKFFFFIFSPFFGGLCFFFSLGMKHVARRSKGMKKSAPFCCLRCMKPCRFGIWNWLSCCVFPILFLGKIYISPPNYHLFSRWHPKLPTLTLRPLSNFLAPSVYLYR